MPGKKSGKKAMRKLTSEEVEQRQAERHRIEAENAANRRVVEVHVVERVERLYTVTTDIRDIADDNGILAKDVTDEEIKVFAEERVRSGEHVIKFRDVNADIEETISVTIIPKEENH